MTATNPRTAAIAQRLQALDRANEVRVRRAQLKKDLKAGRVAIEIVLLEPPAFMLTATVFDVLIAAPKYGSVKVTRLLDRARISPSKQLGAMTERQRAELVHCVTTR